jgi:DNA repair exonuclease SbcCD ATPase subunit
MSQYYGTLCGHPYYEAIWIDADQRNVRGVLKNTYNIRAYNPEEKKETLVSTRFSTGQMNCAALSIFLSLASILDRRCGFVILDDPSQSLDTAHKRFLTKVLEDVSKRLQVIVSTQDAELQTEIAKGFSPKGGYLAIDYEGWSEEGPTTKSRRSD